MAEPAALRRYLQRYDPDVALFVNSRPSPAVFAALQALGWTFVYLDNQYSVMVPQRPNTVALIGTSGYHHLIPWENRYPTTATAAEVLGEADRALRTCPEQATFAWAYRANALKRLGRPDEAREAASHIPGAPILQF
jgi:hypothetical protein